MTKRQKQKLVVLLIAVGISLFTYSKDYFVTVFPQLQTLPFMELQKKEDVKGETTLAEIVRIVDGDTIVVSLGGKEEKVRLIGVNTPETVDPRKPVECFGKEAKEYMKQLLSGKKIRLEADTTQQERDRYGRLLRYIFLENGLLVNQVLIRDGYAYEYTYDLPYKYQSEFKKAETDARNAGRGLWNSGACNGEK